MATKTAEKPQTTAAPKEAPTGNLPAQQQAKKKPLIVEFREYVQQRMATLEDALPPTIPPKRFVSVLMTALQNKPKLLECTFASLWNACVRAAQDGLLPDGREGAIAPYGENKDGKRTAEIATWMPMVEGYRKKVFEAGGVLAWEVNVVYEKDEFDYELGDNAFICHKPYIGAESSGGVVGAYSRAQLASGAVVREVMSAYQIMQVKSKSKAEKGPWSDAQAFPEMCKKTVARRHYKQLPHSESMDAMIARDDEENGFADPEATPIARPERRQLSSRQVMDQYAGATDGAGQVIDHDADGEVTERSDNQVADTTGEKTGGDGASKGAAATTGSSTGAAASTGKAEAAKASTAEGGATGQASASSSNSTSTTGDASPGGGAAEAGASGGATTGAPASTTSDEMPDDDAVDDGADRPWPPGSDPTDAPEYERYLKSKLAEITDASKVAPFFNSAEQKELRVKCECAAQFKELQDLAIARRKELSDKPVR